MNSTASTSENGHTQTHGPIEERADARKQLASGIAAVEETARAADDRVRRFVAERPVVALLGAVAAGFLVGRLLSRS